MAAVLITGGTGYLGQFLTRHFAASGLKASRKKWAAGSRAAELLQLGCLSLRQAACFSLSVRAAACAEVRLWLRPHTSPAAVSTPLVQVGFTYWHCTEPDQLCCTAVQGFKVRLCCRLVLHFVQSLLSC